MASIKKTLISAKNKIASKTAVATGGLLLTGATLFPGAGHAQKIITTDKKEFQKEIVLDTLRGEIREIKDVSSTDKKIWISLGFPSQIEYDNTEIPDEKGVGSYAIGAEKDMDSRGFFIKAFPGTVKDMGGGKFQVNKDQVYDAVYALMTKKLGVTIVGTPDISMKYLYPFVICDVNRERFLLKLKDTQFQDAEIIYYGKKPNLGFLYQSDDWDYIFNYYDLVSMQKFKKDKSPISDLEAYKSNSYYYEESKFNIISLALDKDGSILGMAGTEEVTITHWDYDKKSKVRKIIAEDVFEKEITDQSILTKGFLKVPKGKFVKYENEGR